MKNIIPVAWVGATEYFESDIDYLITLQLSAPEVIKWTDYGLGVLAKYSK